MRNIRCGNARLGGGTLALAQAAAAQSLVIGTSSPGGSYFLMGGGLSTAITRDLEGITLSTRTTAGSTTNMRMLSREGGGLNLGLANLGAVYNAVTSTGKFKGKPPAKNVRALMALTISPIHWVTLAKDDIKAFADLKGKRVSLAKAGSGTAANADLILRTVGVRDQIKAQFLGFSEAGNALRDGNIDAFAVASAVPVPVVSAMAATRKIRLIPLAPSGAQGACSARTRPSRPMSSRPRITATAWSPMRNPTACRRRSWPRTACPTRRSTASSSTCSPTRPTST